MTNKIKKIFFFVCLGFFLERGKKRRENNESRGRKTEVKKEEMKMEFIKKGEKR